MEFKAGDRVRVRGWEDMEKQFGVDNGGNIKANCYFTRDMRPLCGKKFKIKQVLDGGIVMGLNTIYKITTDMIEIAGHDARMQINVGDMVVAGKNNIGAASCEGKEGVVMGVWFSGDEFPYLVDFGKGEELWCAASKKGSAKRITVKYAEGQPTIAKLIIDGKVTNTATAKCNPDDEYDDKIGIDMAIERLFEKPKSGEGAKKKYFSLAKYIDDRVNCGESGQEIARSLKWAMQCDGQEVKNGMCMGCYGACSDWCVEK